MVETIRMKALPSLHCNWRPVQNNADFSPFLNLQIQDHTTSNLTRTWQPIVHQGCGNGENSERRANRAKRMMLVLCQTQSTNYNRGHIR